MSKDLLDRKMDDVAATGAEVVVSANPGCLLQLEWGAKRAKSNVKVKHVTQVLLEAIEERESVMRNAPELRRVVLRGDNMEVPVTTEQAGAAPAQPAHTIVGVRFMPVGKIYHFDATRLPDVRVDDWVMVTTARGKQMGQVAAINPSKHNAADGPLKSIERLATNRDLALKKYWETQEVGGDGASGARSAQSAGSAAADHQGRIHV